MGRKILAFLTLVFLILSPFRLPEAQAASPYAISVDVTNQIVTVYRVSDGEIVRQMLCSSGDYDSTPCRTFVLPQKDYASERGEWYYMSNFECWVKYATRIFKGIMFHSIPCSQRADWSISRTALAQYGYPASHGCIRLLEDDAKFIAENCPAGTYVKIYKSEEFDEDLRDLLFTSSFTGEDGMTYREFLGIPADDSGALGRGSSGSEVRDLQYRLRALGYFNGEVDGEYKPSTITAVKRIQLDLRQKANGIVTSELKDVIFSSEAPTSTEVELTQGTSGPVIRNLQEDLTTLCLYSGDIDSVYDVDVVDSVMEFQRMYGYPESRSALPIVQKAIHYEAEQIRIRFAGTEYTSHITTDLLYSGTIKSNARIRLREQPTTDSKALGALSTGTTVVVLETAEEWTKVRYGTTVGYVLNKYLVDVKPWSTDAREYVSTDGERTYHIGFSGRDYLDGVQIPAERFAAYLASGGEDVDSGEPNTEYATVQTPNEGQKLNLRQSPSTDSAILAELENETELLVLLHSSDWSLVQYGDKQGYLMNQYLNFWMGHEHEELNQHLEDEYQMTVYAVVRTQGTPTADVFDLDSEDANRIGYLPNNTLVTVVRSDEFWSFIDYQGHQGYMPNTSLSFILTED